MIYRNTIIFDGHILLDLIPFAFAYELIGFCKLRMSYILLRDED